MALDFGGLDYTISVRDQFSANVDAFRAGITGARADFAKLKRELGQPVRSTGQRELARATRDTTKALTAEEQAIRRTRRERRDAVRVLSLSRAAKIRLGRETRKLAVAQAAANLEVRRNLVNSRQQLAADQLRVRAERDLSKVIDARGRSEATLAAARERGVTLTNEELRKLKLLTIEQEKLFLARKKLAAQVALAGNKELVKINAETAALKQQNRILQQQANLRALQARGLAPGGVAARRVSPEVENRTFRDRIRNFLQLDKSQQAAAASANRFSFTFRRLIGILAAFTIVRLIVRGFTDLVRQLVLFNANIEQATLGIASLFTAVGDVRDATGQAASASQALAIAQEEARRQTQLLRRDALQTAATFDKLLETFQVAVAPGLAAGLDLDEIRDFTVRISQAASAIGLQQNQLAEEIRSILAGTIQARTTRIAVALGITNEDIRLAKEAGVLTQFLNERFEAFKQSGIEALGTFNALLTNTRDAILLLFEEGGLEFFDELKGLLADIQGLIRQTDITGALTPNPAAVGIVRAIADGLRVAVAQVRALVSEEGLGGLEGLATIIGQTIGLVSTVLAPVIAGILAGLNDIKDGFQAIQSVISDLGLDEIFGGEILSEAVKQFFRIATALAVVGVAAIAFLGTFKLIVAAAALLPGILLSSAGIIGLAIVAIGLFVGKMKELVEEVFGAQIGFAAFLELVATAFGLALIKAFLTIENGFRNLFSNIRIAILTVTRFLAINFLQAVEGVLGVLATISDTAADALEEVVRLQDQINDGLEREIQLSRDAKRARDLELRVVKRRLDTALAKDVEAAIGDAAEAAFDLAGILDTVPGIIGRARQPLESQGNLLKELADDAKKAADALRFSGETLGLGGNVLAQRRIEFEALVKLRESGLQLTNQEREAQEDLRNIERSRVRTARALAALGKTTQFLIEKTSIDSTSVLRKRTQLLTVESQIVLETLRVEKATGRDKEEAEKRLAVAIEEERVLKNQIRNLDLRLVNTGKQLGRLNATKEAQDEINKIITARVTLGGLEVVANDKIREITADRLRLERAINLATNDRLQLTAQVAAQELSEETLRTRIEIENTRRELAAAGLNTFQQEAIEVQGRIRSTELELQLEFERQIIRKGELEDLIERRKLQAESFLISNSDLTRQQQIALVVERQVAAQKRLDDAKKAGDTDEAAAAQKSLDDANALLSTLRTIELLDIQLRLTDENDVETLKRINAELDELRAKALAINNLKVDAFGKQLGDAINEATISLKTFGIQAVGEFSKFASDAIVDAFDPTKDVNLKERFASFLQSIARQILELTIRIAILRAFGGVGGAATGGQIAAARPIPRFAAGGGRIGDFASAQGFEGGGVPNKPAPASMRPPSLPPTDKVPIWTTAGEWVIKKASAAKYGNAVMSAINRGLIDPSALRSLAGIGGRHTVRSSRGPGFQEGGLISDAIAAQNEADEAAADEGTTGLQILPTLLADRTTMQRLVDNGGEVLLDFLRENQDQINTQDNTRVG